MYDDDLQWREIRFDENEVGKTDEEKAQYIEANIWEKVEKYGKKISFLKDVMALYAYFKDPLVSWYRKGIVIAALVYFIFPIDTIPDIAPLIGYLDDLAVISAVLKFMGSEIKPYYILD